MRHFTTKFISLVLFITLGACTSNQSDAPSDNEEVANEATSEISDVAADTGTEESGDASDFGSEETVNGDTAAAEPAEGDSIAATDEAAAAGDEFGDLEGDTSTDQAMQDPATEAPAEGTVANEEDPFADPADAGTEEKTAEADPFADPAAPAESNLSTDTTAEAAPTESAPSTDELAGMGAATDTGYTEAPVQASLKKMETIPYTKNGVLVNAIYMARNGDTLTSVSQKIYGANRVKQLKSVNGHLASRSLVVGDKIYYNSPQRPTDDRQLLTYYEDMGLSPEYYVAQDGDNIRNVGKQLLGDSKSWKEIWATNMDVESKDVLAGGTRLRYWAGDVGMTAPPPMAMGQTDMNQPPPQEIPPMPDQSQMAQNEPLAPPVDQMQQAAPPPPAQNLAIQEAPPPPPPVEAPKVEAQPATGPMSGILGGDDTTALIAGAVLLLAAVFMVIIIRKRKTRKNIDFHTATHTQLE